MIFCFPLLLRLLSAVSGCFVVMSMYDVQTFVCMDYGALFCCVLLTSGCILVWLVFSSQAFGSSFLFRASEARQRKACERGAMVLE